MSLAVITRIKDEWDIEVKDEESRTYDMEHQNLI